MLRASQSLSSQFSWKHKVGIFMFTLQKKMRLKEDAMEGPRGNEWLVWDLPLSSLVPEPIFLAQTNEKTQDKSEPK